MSVIPLILLTLTENMVKHGNQSSPDDLALITIKVEDGYLLISTGKLKNRDKRQQFPERTV